MFNNNHKAIEALQRHVGPFMLILLLLSSLLLYLTCISLQPHAFQFRPFHFVFFVDLNIVTRNG